MKTETKIWKPNYMTDMQVREFIYLFIFYTLFYRLTLVNCIHTFEANVKLFYINSLGFPKNHTHY